jgi:hypothetical protein
VQSRVISCGIGDRRNGTGTGFSQTFFGYLGPLRRATILLTDVLDLKVCHLICEPALGWV